MKDDHESESDLKKKTTMLARHGGAYMPVIPARRSQTEGLDCARQQDLVSKNTKEERKKRRRRRRISTLNSRVFFFNMGMCLCIYVCGEEGCISTEAHRDQRHQILPELGL